MAMSERPFISQTLDLKKLDTIFFFFHLKGRPGVLETMENSLALFPDWRKVGVLYLSPTLSNTQYSISNPLGTIRYTLGSGVRDETPQEEEAASVKGAVSRVLSRVPGFEFNKY